jgi:hypothetical protein
LDSEEEALEDCPISIKDIDQLPSGWHFGAASLPSDVKNGRNDVRLLKNIPISIWVRPQLPFQETGGTMHVAYDLAL